MARPRRLSRISFVALALLGGAYLVPGRAVVNGIPTRDYPQVLELEIQSSASAKAGRCTGSAIGEGKILTAAHCFCGLNPKRISLIVDQRFLISGASVAVHPRSRACEHRYVDAEIVHDVAVVTVPSRTTNGMELNSPLHDEFRRVGFASLADRTPPVGAPIAIVGYGNDRYVGRYQYGGGIKRMGENIVDAVLPTNEIVRLRGRTGYPLRTSLLGLVREELPADGTLAVGATGDSGGPLLYRGEIVGVDSQGGVDDEKRGFSEYASVVDAGNRDFIADALRTPLVVDLQEWIRLSGIGR